MPGGAEALTHWRTSVESAAQRGLIDPIVVADLDMQNFFNSVEWVSIRKSIATHFKAASPCISWEQSERATTFLPDGASFRVDRGSEQGESLGPIKAVLPLGDSLTQVRAEIP